MTAQAKLVVVACTLHNMIRRFGGVNDSFERAFERDERRRLLLLLRRQRGDAATDNDTSSFRGEGEVDSQPATEVRDAIAKRMWLDYRQYTRFMD